MATVLITGVTGRVGANLAAALLRRGWQVRGLIRERSPHLSRIEGLDIERRAADLRDLDSVMAAAEGVDAIVHCAALIRKPERMSDQEYFEVNVNGTRNVVEAVARAAPNLGRLVYVSTDATYPLDEGETLPITEEHPQQPRSLYGLTKLLGEKIALQPYHTSGLPTTIARIGWVMQGAKVLGLFSARSAISALRGYSHPRSTLYVPGVAEPWRPIDDATADPDTLVIPRNPRGESWIHNPTDIHDVVQGLMLALEHPAAVGEAFNYFAPGPTTWEEGARYLHERSGRALIEVTLPNYWAWYCDVSKARRLLGYEPSYDYRRMIDDALAFEHGEDIGVIPE